jgi:hypothetical protein
MTGLYVSLMMHERPSATPDSMRAIQSIHRQPRYCVTKPPMIGPSTIVRVSSTLHCPAGGKQRTWAVHRTNTPDRHGQGSLVVLHQVGNHTGSARDHDTAEEGANEADDDECLDRLAERTGDDQDSENKETADGDRSPSVDLAHRSHEHRPDGQANQVEG